MFNYWQFPKSLQNSWKNNWTIIFKTIYLYICVDTGKVIIHNKLCLCFLEAGKNGNNKGYGGVILIDLSKTFATLNQELLILKLHAYVFDESSLKLLHSYLSSRWYRTKVSYKLSSWTKLIKSRTSRISFRASSFQYILKWFIFHSKICWRLQLCLWYTIPCLWERFKFVD